MNIRPHRCQRQTNKFLEVGWYPCGCFQKIRAGTYQKKEREEERDEDEDDRGSVHGSPFRAVSSVRHGESERM